MSCVGVRCCDLTPGMRVSLLFAWECSDSMRGEMKCDSPMPSRSAPSPHSHVPLFLFCDQSTCPLLSVRVWRPLQLAAINNPIGLRICVVGLEGFGRDEDRVLAAKVADQVEGLQSLDDVVGSEVRHLAELFDGDRTAVL